MILRVLPLNFISLRYQTSSSDERTVGATCDMGVVDEGNLCLDETLAAVAIYLGKLSRTGLQLPVSSLTPKPP